MRKFSFIEHTADVGIKITGDSVEELFVAAFEGWGKTVYYKMPVCQERKTLELSAGSAEELLVDFLNELNFLLFTRKWAAGRIENISISAKGSEHYLKATIAGQKTDAENFELKEEIKAVTYGGLEIKKQGKLFTARVIFDI